MPVSNISIKNLIKRFWKKTALTWIMVVLEGLCLVIMPMIIGWAVDDLMNESWAGIIQLAVLSIALLVIGSLRRLYDTRIYAKIYTTVANELVQAEKKKNTNLSKMSARVNLLTEFIQFLEDSMPAILNHLIGLIGTLLIIFFISFKVFAACLVAAVFTAIVYAISERRIYQLNRGGNSELEKQVDVLRSGKNEVTGDHFKKLMNWQIKLSDLETLNFSLIWIVLAGVLVFSIVTMTSDGHTSFGQIVAVVMYVFGFTESIMTFPLYYQQLIRLKEIAVRLTPGTNRLPGKIELEV